MRPLFLISSKLPANAMAIFPFIILKNKALKVDKVLINHERIHFKQQLELLIIPFYILYLLNYLINLIRYKNHYLAYFNILFEKEAYHFDDDLSYLTHRKVFAWIRFAKKNA
ncbi:hypothetical protein [Pedobacter foliorum]|uniref:hypothetical protein n=1 Tax=Pedobacter foliorum TaxID=2739058 RepID=UPI001C278704|nr:hypothetical protein [Pedobacter foliorum]